MVTIAKALQYIKEHEGTLTPLAFVEHFDHPNDLWDALLAKGYATIREGHIYLTTIGEKML